MQQRTTQTQARDVDITIEHGWHVGDVIRLRLAVETTVTLDLDERSGAIEAHADTRVTL